MTTNSLTCHIPLVVSLLLVVIACDVRAFVVPGSPSRSLKLSSSSVHRSSTTQLAFGFFPSSSDKDDSKDDKKKKNSNAEEPKLQKKSVGLKGLVQLITAGAGAPFLGDFEGVDEETGKFMFSLEANNLVDENGNSKQTSMPYFESGWVPDEDEERSSFKFPWQK